MFLSGEMVPEATLAAIREYVVALKGPLTTPVSGGFRSLNVALRKALDLYANVRPIYWIPGVPTPVSHPERLDIVIFREATEDVYAGIEWEKGSPEAQRMIEILEKEFRTRVRADSGIGVKPVSEAGSKRLVRKAIRYAIENGRKSVTLVHKGNIMKYTEGAFRTWGYEVARDEFRDSTISWDAIVKDHGGEAPDGKVVIKDVIADNMFQQLLLRPEEYDVLATHMPGAKGVRTSAFAQAVVEAVNGARRCPPARATRADRSSRPPSARRWGGRVSTTSTGPCASASRTSTVAFRDTNPPSSRGADRSSSSSNPSLPSRPQRSSGSPGSWNSTPRRSSTSS